MRSLSALVVEGRKSHSRVMQYPLAPECVLDYTRCIFHFGREAGEAQNDMDVLGWTSFCVSHVLTPVYPSQLRLGAFCI